VPDLVRQVSPLRDARCLGQLKALIQKIRPDVIHTHSSKAGILGRMAGWAVWQGGAVRADDGGARPAVVHTIHGPPFMPIEGGLAKRLKVRANNLIYTLAERHAANRCHAIVSVADAMSQQFLARGIGRPELYTTVRSGMDLRPYTHPASGEDRDAMRLALGIRSEHFVIGTVARLAEHKGHADVLAALGMMQQRADHAGLMKDTVLLWVGDGWLREQLLQSASAGGGDLRYNIVELDKAASPSAAWKDADPSRPTIVLTGLVPPQRVPGLIRAMDVLCHPSYREGLPRTVPQALLCGVCPVAYDVDGTKEACIDGVTGKLVPLADIAALAAALASVRQNPEARAKLAEAGRSMCEEQWSTEAMVSGLERVYERAMARAGR
jgi:glycosyltransferase involved in cell wall biosynthesis